MKILVTGGAGFIGSHLVEKLIHDGHQVTVFDDFNDYYDPRIKRRNLEKVIDRIELIEGDIRDVSLVERSFANSGFDAVYHLAARAGVRPSIQDPKLYVTTNIDGTFNILDACRYHGVPRFVFASSSSVYGVNKKAPFSERDAIERTISPYAATKLSSEQICSNYSHLFGISCLCLRLFTVYGPRQRPDLAISRFVTKIKNGEALDRYGDGNSSRDYTFVSDIVDGLVAGLSYDETPFEIINLGGSQTTSLNELIEVIEEVLEKTAVINPMPAQAGDVPRTLADISKAKQLLGFKPSIDLRRGIEKFVDWTESV